MSLPTGLLLYNCEVKRNTSDSIKLYQLHFAYSKMLRSERSDLLEIMCVAITVLQLNGPDLVQLPLLSTARKVQKGILLRTQEE